MATENNRVMLAINDEELLQALRQAMACNFLDNLRDRNPFVKLDSSIRGYVGEICFRKWLTTEGVQITSANLIQDGQDIDVDLTLSNAFASDIKLELKTSLIPDVWKNLETVIDKADIKIIKREHSFYDIPADFHVQIYFNQLTKARDTALKQIVGLPTDYSEAELIEKMRLGSLRQAVVAWIDKASLISLIESLVYKTWNFGMRTFWKCPLRMAKDANLLPSAIKAYIR